jgi:hypothetical protein
MGVFYFQARARRAAFDKIKVSHGILSHFETTYNTWSTNFNRQLDEPLIHTWASEYAVGWYQWAMCGKGCPAGPAFEASLYSSPRGDEMGNGPDGIGVVRFPEEPVDSEPIQIRIDSDLLV